MTLIRNAQNRGLIIDEVGGADKILGVTDHYRPKKRPIVMLIIM